MSGIFSSLSNATQALQTHGKMVELAGKNISNLNNPDYARQRLSIRSIGTAAPVNEVRSGALVAIGVEQFRDQFLDRQLLNEMSYTSSLETQDFRLRQLLSSLGESIDRINDPAFISDAADEGTGLRSTIDSFFNAFEAFSARPSDASTKQVLFQAAKNLTEGFNRMDSRLESMDQSLDDEIESELSGLNERLSELSELNRQVARLEQGNNPGAANDLRDQRQSKLEEIAEIIQMEAVEVPSSGGQVRVTVRDSNGDPYNLLDVGSEPISLLYDASTGVFRSSLSGTGLDLQAGRLPALVEVKNTHVADIRKEIDTLANTLATEVNELYYQAFVPAGTDPAVPEVSFFQQPTPPPSISGNPSTITAGTLALYTGSSDPAVTDSIPLTAENLRATHSDMGGANDLASAIAALGSQDLADLGNMGLTEYAINSVVSLGQTISGIGDRLDVQRTIEAVLSDQQAQVSGVSLDEEMANMVQFQRAFQASSRVFNILSEMLETIVTGLR